MVTQKMGKLELKIGCKGESKLKKINKIVLCILLVFALGANLNLKSVIAKEAPSTTESVKEESKQEGQKKTKGQERAEELAKMPLSGKSPAVYMGLIAVSVIALGCIISLGKSTKKKDRFT